MRGFDAVDSPQRMAHRNFAGDATQSVDGDDDTVQPVDKLRWCLRRDWGAGEHVPAYVQAGETDHKYCCDEQREQSTSRDGRWPLCAIADRFLAQVFRPCPSENGDASDKEKPMVAPDKCRAAAKADSREKERSNAAYRRKKRRRRCGGFRLHVEMLNPLAW